MPALVLCQGGGQVDELHEAVDRLVAAWDSLAVALARQLEGWADGLNRVQAALDNVQAATREADALVARVLTNGGN